MGMFFKTDTLLDIMLSFCFEIPICNASWGSSSYLDLKKTSRQT